MSFAAPYVAWAIPAVLGAGLAWKWWLVYLLLIPGALLYLTVERYRKRSPALTLGQRYPIVYALPALLVIALVSHPLQRADRYLGLVATASLIIADLYRRERR
jgi:hypothetical protein